MKKIGFTAWLLLFISPAFSQTLMVFGYGASGSHFAKWVSQKSTSRQLIVIEPLPERKCQAQADLKAYSTIVYSSIDDITDEQWRTTDIIMEQITEDIDKKRALIKQISNRLDDVYGSAIIASSSSSIPVGLLVAELNDERARKFALNHVYLPFGSVSEVGVINDSDEALQTLERLVEFNDSIGIQSFKLNNRELTIDNQIGHAFNRVWFQVKTLFLALEDKQLISKQMADLAFILVYGRMPGFFTIVNHIGLETVINIRSIWQNYGAFFEDIPNAVLARLASGRMYYNKDDKPMDIEWLIDHRYAPVTEAGDKQIEDLLHYSYQYGLQDQCWESTTTEIVENLLSKERQLSDPQRDDRLMQLFLEDERFRYVCYLLIKVSLLEYENIIINHQVLDVKLMDELLHGLTGQTNFLNGMYQIFMDTSMYRYEKDAYKLQLDGILV